MPTPAMASGGTKDGYAEPFSVSHGEPHQRRRSAGPGRSTRSARSPDAAGDDAGDRGDDHRRGGPGQRPQRRPRAACSPARPAGTAMSRKTVPNMPKREGQPDHVGDREARDRGTGAAAARRSVRPRAQSDVRRHQQRRRPPAARAPPAELQPASLPCTMPQMPRKTAPPSSAVPTEVEPLPGAPGLADRARAAAGPRRARRGR